MSHKQVGYIFYCCIITAALLVASCSSKDGNKGDIASSPGELKEKVISNINNFLKKIGAGSEGRTDSSQLLKQPELVKFLYEKNGYNPFWSGNHQWKAGGDSLLILIARARYYGLFPDDYHQQELDTIHKQFAEDSLGKKSRRDALLWARADLLLTDAFVQISKDVKLGRLPDDSVSLNKDTILTSDFLLTRLNNLKETGAFKQYISSLEPVHWGYHQLKEGIENFLKQASFKNFTTVPGKDSSGYKAALQKRLFEGGYLLFDSVQADSALLADAVKKFQQEKGLTVDGKAGEGTIRMLNLSDKEKMVRIAISLDKYKKLPAKMPAKYIWVNASSNYLDVVDKSGVEFTSKVICGKPKTRTPQLNSQVSALITYPQWVPPPSIVIKEILPAVKKNPGYLARKGFSLLDKDGNEVDPYSVDWSKYSKGIPYKVVQGSGDANALGVLKFHFDNKYSVYLHDTNQRYLFANAMRSLSHGCVRVQDWQKLALYLLKNDSLKSPKSYHMSDSLKTWLARKEKHHISLKNRMPVYIRYITCEARNGQVVFYDDVYGEDKMLRQKYYASK